MKFNKHLFISYAHIDNEPLPPDKKGWITQFHEALDALLSMKLGSKAQIWRDEKLNGNDDFAQEIVDQFPETLAFVAILSPRYVRSEWCTKEVKKFCDQAQETGGVEIANKKRVFKVIKTPVTQQESLPETMGKVLGYNFFTDVEGAPLELDPTENRADYRKKVNKLAWDIKELLQEIEGGKKETDKPTVYLASCSFDRRKKRDELEAELQRLGYHVLPESPLPREKEEFTDSVSELLKECTLSIHLIGSKYGAVPEGPSNNKSETILQNEAAAIRSKKSKLTRVIWLPQETAPEESEQKAFIKKLHENPDAQFGADLITGGFKDLKNAIHTNLQKANESATVPHPAGISGSAGPVLIYLICVAEDRDSKATVPIRKYLLSLGYEVVIPAFEGDSSAIGKAHRQTLAGCDAVLLFYGAGDEAWKRTVSSDLKKMRGYRNGKCLLANYTYLAPPDSPDKRDLIDLAEHYLIDGRQSFTEESMAKFVEAIQKTGDTK